ncbi:MAG: glycoside hydrolase family 130 protein [Calditrichales bacterium]|nr:glycoside hydrolase family 130 protein [Calditrichales bacterium]
MKYLFLVLSLIIFINCSNSSQETNVKFSLPFKEIKRAPENPILSPSSLAWESKDLFNPSSIEVDGKIALLYRAEDSTGIGVWNGTSRIGLAWSEDGIHFKREEKPVLEPSEPYELPGGCEDPRVVKIEDTFYLTYTAYDGKTARLCLASSKDLYNWNKHGPLFPDLGWTKAGVIVPQNINGKYYMFFGEHGVWLASSPDLLNWELVQEDHILPLRPNMFDSNVTESGPTPILNDQGILVIYNGAEKTNSGRIYRTGYAYFSKQDPAKLLYRCSEPFFHPQELSEKTGQVANVVFVEGLTFFKGKWFMYYGMADSHIGVAVSQ